MCVYVCFERNYYCYAFTSSHAIYICGRSPTSPQGAGPASFRVALRYMDNAYRTKCLIAPH